MAWTTINPIGDIDISAMRGQIAEYHRQYVNPEPGNTDDIDTRMRKMLARVRDLFSANELKLDNAYRLYRRKANEAGKIESDSGYRSKTLRVEAEQGCEMLPSTFSFSGNGHKGHKVDGGTLFVTIGGQHIRCTFTIDAVYSDAHVAHLVKGDLDQVRAALDAANLPTDEWRMP